MNRCCLNFDEFISLPSIKCLDRLFFCFKNYHFPFHISANSVLEVHLLPNLTIQHNVGLYHNSVLVNSGWFKWHCKDVIFVA